MANAECFPSEPAGADVHTNDSLFPNDPAATMGEQGACCETATLRRNRVVPKILEARRHFSANLVDWSTAAVCESAAQKGSSAAKGSVQMIRFVIDTVLFSCMGAIVTGVVIAAATLLG
jgi:hypothetical protein